MSAEAFTRDKHLLVKNLKIGSVWRVAVAAYGGARWSKRREKEEYAGECESVGERRTGGVEEKRERVEEETRERLRGRAAVIEMRK